LPDRSVSVGSRTVHERSPSRERDNLSQLVAKKIIEIAQTGELDPLRLSTQAISELGIPDAA
jgi:hypothetical protein